ncbi:phage tail protein [Salmonella enterica]|nr:phage tail protein [Salmonella enterica]EJX2180371.1 phage tail protein [Salmonella enterica]ELI2186392.1 phage tail protein [Salmonella enterica]
MGTIPEPRTRFFTLITRRGLAALTRAANGEPLRLTHMAVGDGGGREVTPTPEQESLVGEVYRAPLNQVYTDPADNTRIIAEMIIPASAGGFRVRETGLYDANGELFAVSKPPLSEIPAPEEGATRDMVVRISLIISGMSNVILTTDSSTVTATKDYVINAVKPFLRIDESLGEIARAGEDAQAAARGHLGLGNSATRNVGTTSGTVAAGDDTRITGAVQKAGDTMTGKLTLPQTSGFGVNTDNVLGGSSVTFGDNDTGIKQNGDGILDFYANGQLVARIAPGVLYALNAVQAGDGKKLAVSSSNNSTLNAGFSLWGDGNRPTVIELGDDQGWHLYSQRNPDGSIVFVVNGDINANTLRAGGATYQNNGDIYGSVWENNWLSIWLNNQFAARDNNINARVTSDYVNQTFVRAVRLGPQAFSGALWRDYQLGGGNVVTGFHTDGDWEMQGNDDHVYYRPVQYLVNGTWVTAASV